MPSPEQTQATDSKASLNYSMKHGAAYAEMQKPKRASCCRSPARCDEHLDSCVVCSALPFRKMCNSISLIAMWEEGGNLDFDGGLYEFINSVSVKEETKISDKLANETVQAAENHLRHLQQKLIKKGLQHHANQNYTGENRSSARVVAPFDREELNMGPLLGTGGFCTVVELRDIKLNKAADTTPRGKSVSSSLTSNDTTSREFSTVEDMSRHHLAKHAQVQQIPTKGKQSSEPLARYAVKHLRNNLTTTRQDKFKRAAVDLVLEGQLLMVLDHPHIISIRGRSSQGPSAFESGNVRDYFLVLDKLPETLEDKIYGWRQKHNKYQRRWRRRHTRQERSRQISGWFRKRWGVQDVESEVPVDKYAVKLQSLFLERLRAARDIASAVAYMHSKEIIHRDLKSSNIGFDIHGDVKLFDLGLARLLPGADKQMADGYKMSRVGTKFYMPPEVRQRKNYDRKADVYSFGVVLWELLSLATPQDWYVRRWEQQQKPQSSRSLGTCQSTDRRPGMFRSFTSSDVASTSSQQDCWLPICPCWPQELKDIIRTSLSDCASQRPTMATIHRVLDRQLDVVTRQLQREQYNPVAARRRSTFRIDLRMMSELVDDDDDDDDESIDVTTACVDHAETSFASSFEQRGHFSSPTSL